MNHPRIGSYAAVDGTGFPFIENGQLVQSRIDAAARYDDLILDAGCVSAFPQIKNALRLANPSIRLHAYQVMATWNNPNGPQMFIDIWNMVQATGGYIASPPPGYCNINPAIAPTMYGLAEIVKKYAVGWDGTFADVLIPKPGTADGFNWRGMGFQSAQAFLDAWEANAAEFVRRLGVMPNAAQSQSSGSQLPVRDVSGQYALTGDAHPTNAVTTNYGRGFPGIAQGNMVEEFEQDWNRWMSSTNEGALHLGFPSAWITSGPLRNSAGFDPLHPENQRRNRFLIGNAALFGGFGSFGRYEGDKEWQRDRWSSKWWFPEYSHPQLGKGWLGVPTGIATPGDSGLWVRMFEHGAVVVNPMRERLSIHFRNMMRPIGGAAKRAFSIPPRDALILEAV